MSTEQETKNDLPGTDLVSVQQADNQRLIVAAKLLDLTGIDKKIPVHNFDGDQSNQWKLSATATGGQHLGLDDVVDKPFGCKYWYMHKIELPGKTDGEYSDAVRTCFIAEDGTSVACLSTGVAQGLANMVSHMGSGPYVPELRLRIVKVKTRRGYNTYNLIPAK